MDKDYILLVDDEPLFKEQFNEKIDLLGINSRLLHFNNVDELRKTLTEIKESSIKFLIFDLCTQQGETESRVFQVSSFIDEFYKKYRNIIFIHSGYLHNFDDYESDGTVFKIEKGPRSIENICNKIKTFEASNFYNLFCQGGIIERNFMDQIHSAFRIQFSGNEIIQIIESVRSSNPSRLEERIEEVFIRIAVKSLYHNLYNKTVSVSETDKIEDVNINAIENYYRRTSEYKYWTGDIFRSIDTGNYVIIINPRCNCSNQKIHHILYCHINILDESQIKNFSKEDGFKKGMTDNVTSSLIGDRYRFLPRTPKFVGGLVDFNMIESLLDTDFYSKYKLHISTSDDLANDIVRKCSSYLVRGGIYVNETKEALYYFKNPNGLQS